MSIHREASRVVVRPANTCMDTRLYITDASNLRIWLLVDLKPSSEDNSRMSTKRRKVLAPGPTAADMNSVQYLRAELERLQAQVHRVGILASSLVKAGRGSVMDCVLLCHVTPNRSCGY